MSDRNTARADVRQAHRVRTARWRQAVLALALAASGTLAWAQDVNPDSTGREPVITRVALEKAKVIGLVVAGILLLSG